MELTNKYLEISTKRDREFKIQQKEAYDKKIVFNLEEKIFELTQENMELTNTIKDNDMMITQKNAIIDKYQVIDIYILQKQNVKNEKYIEEYKKLLQEKDNILVKTEVDAIITQLIITCENRNDQKLFKEKNKILQENMLFTLEDYLSRQVFNDINNIYYNEVNKLSNQLIKLKATANKYISKNNNNNKTIQLLNEKLITNENILVNYSIKHHNIINHNDKLIIDNNQLNIDNANLTEINNKYMAEEKSSISIEKYSISKFIGNNHKINNMTINNIYQTHYRNNVAATGIGDFIRGCYFMLEFSDRFNLQVNFVINHPINTFLKNNTANSSFNTYNVTSIKLNNWDDSIVDNNNFVIANRGHTTHYSDFITQLIALKTPNHSVNIYNIMTPLHDIPYTYKDKMRYLLQPSEELLKYINSTLETYKLTKQKYIVIHIRIKDTKESLNNSQLQKLYQTLDVVNKNYKSEN